MLTSDSAPSMRSTVLKLEFCCIGQNREVVFRQIWHVNIVGTRDFHHTRVQVPSSLLAQGVSNFSQDSVAAIDNSCCNIKALVVQLQQRMKRGSPNVPGCNTCVCCQSEAPRLLLCCEKVAQSIDHPRFTGATGAARYTSCSGLSLSVCRATISNARFCSQFSVHFRAKALIPS